MHAAALASLLAALLGSASAANPTKLIVAFADSQAKPQVALFVPDAEEEDDTYNQEVDLNDLSLFFNCKSADGLLQFDSLGPYNEEFEGSSCLNPQLSVFTVEGFKNAANKANRAQIIEKATNVSFKAWKAFLGPKKFRKIVASIT